MIIAGGDSFVYGVELPDCTIATSSRMTFPALLSQGSRYICTAWPGAGNDSIARNVITACEQNKSAGVIVSWTFPGRYEFRFGYNVDRRNDNWYNISPWTIKTDVNEIKSEFVTDNDKIFKKHVETIQHANSTGVADFARSFYYHVGGTEYWEIYSTLKEIVYLQNYLKLNQMPYLFTCADNSIFYNHTIREADGTIKSLLNQIDQDSWFWFPGQPTPKGFYQWAADNKYPIGATHPLEQAHQVAAQLMQGKFNEMVKNYLE